MLTVGIDEAGCGPLAGPVIAAAVILAPGQRIRGLADSKLLSPGVRVELAAEIHACAYAYALGRAEVEEIDAINILQARLLAMRRAVASLSCAPDCALIDGLHTPRLHCPSLAIVKGDQKIAAISAASIVAKVARDSEMTELAVHYPGYGFDVHKGYATRAHIQALATLGVCALHRLSFAPVRARLPYTSCIDGRKNTLCD